MTKWLEECRMLYNNFLGQRKDGWNNNKKKFSLYDQHAKLPSLKRKYPKLKTVYAQVLQNVGMRVDLAYQAFFRRVKRHEKPGYPRFKSYGRYDSFCYPSCLGVKQCEDFVRLPKVGDVSWIRHREILGNMKTATVKRSHGKWFVFIVTDNNNHKTLDVSNETVAIDVGIKTFATLSDGSSVNNPRFFETKQKQLARKNRAFQKARDQKRGTKKALRALRHVHEKIGNSRHNFAHQTANTLVNKYGTIIVEDINVNSLIKKRWCNKQILDAAWGNFTAILTNKAECAGRKLVKVNPAYTSQTCSKCGTRTLHELKERVFRCSCGYLADRDLNASLNILALGLQSLSR